MASGAERRSVEKLNFLERRYLAHDIAAVVELLRLPNSDRHALALVAARHGHLLVPSLTLRRDAQAGLLGLLAVDDRQIAIVATFETSNGASDLPVL